MPAGPLIRSLRAAAARIKRGLPLGSCPHDQVADRIVDAPPAAGLLAARRHRPPQRSPPPCRSFEADIDFAGLDDGQSLHAVFIRAPWVEDAGPGVQILATIARGPAAGRIVAVRQGALLATSFHPEISGDPRVHQLFLDQVKES